MIDPVNVGNIIQVVNNGFGRISDHGQNPAVLRTDRSLRTLAATTDQCAKNILFYNTSGFDRPDLNLAVTDWS